MAESYSQYGGVPMGYDSSTGAAMPSYNVGGSTHYAYNPDSLAYAPGMSYNDQLGIYGFKNPETKNNNAWISAAVDVGNALLGYYSQSQTNKQNQKNQEKAWELNSLIHRYQEFQALGLNKQLLSGNTPNYTLSTSMQNPYKPVDAYGKYLAARQAELNQDLMYLQKNAALMGLQQQAYNNAILGEEYHIKKNQRLLSDHDAGILLARNVATTDPSATRLVLSIGDALQDLGKFKDKVFKSVFGIDVDETMEQAAERDPEVKIGLAAMRRIGFNGDVNDPVQVWNWLNKGENASKLKYMIKHADEWYDKK